MAVSAKLYGKFPLNAIGGTNASDVPMDLLSDTIKLTLHTSTYTPVQATDQIKATATNELSTAGGYTALGQSLGSKTYATSSLVTTFDAADVTWSATTFTYRYGVVWDDSTTAPVDALILYVDTGGDQTSSSTDLNFVWSASGLFTITVA